MDDPRQSRSGNSGSCNGAGRLVFYMFLQERRRIVKAASAAIGVRIEFRCNPPLA